MNRTMVFEGTKVNEKSKKSGNLYSCVYLSAIKTTQSGNIYTKSLPAFLDAAEVEKIAKQGYIYGDIIECEYKASEDVDRAPEFVKINKVLEKSVFAKYAK